MKNEQKNITIASGFAAITAVLLTAGILLAVVASASIDAGLFFDQATRKEYRTLDYYAASDCINMAVLNLAHDYFFAPNSEMLYPDLHCSILTVSGQGNARTISVAGKLAGTAVYRKATVVLDDSSVKSVSIQ